MTLNPGPLTAGSGRPIGNKGGQVSHLSFYDHRAMIIRCQGFSVVCLPVRASKQACTGHPDTLKKKSRIFTEICFPPCLGSSAGKLLEHLSKIVYRFENCLGFAIASVVSLLISSHFSKFNKHFAEEQNNWSHTRRLPDLFYTCVQHRVTENMFRPNTSAHA